MGVARTFWVVPLSSWTAAPGLKGLGVARTAPPLAGPAGVGRAGGFWRLSSPFCTVFKGVGGVGMVFWVLPLPTGMLPFSIAPTGLVGGDCVGETFWVFPMSF